jgi:hypothetical protein
MNADLKSLQSPADQNPAKSYVTSRALKSGESRCFARDDNAVRIRYILYELK